MERIREALERARKEREGKGLGFGGSTAKAVPPFTAQNPLGDITYTQTKMVKVSRSALREKRVVNGFEPGIFTDANKILCTQVLQRLRENGWNSLAIVSPGENEGKTLTAINLAISLSLEVDHTVLLVDADLRHPGVHTYFGIKPGQGLSDYLTGGASVEQLLVNPGIEHFVLLPGGKPLLNSSEMLGSPKMAELVQELKNRYPTRIVLFDLPPVLSAADAMAFSPYVDAALLVVEEGKTKRDDVARAVEMLSSTRIIGTVLNKSLELEMPEEIDSNWFKRVFKRGSH